MPAGDEQRERESIRAHKLLQQLRPWPLCRAAAAAPACNPQAAPSFRGQSACGLTCDVVEGQVQKRQSLGVPVGRDGRLVEVVARYVEVEGGDEACSGVWARASKPLATVDWWTVQRAASGMASSGNGSTMPHQLQNHTCGNAPVPTGVKSVRPPTKLLLASCSVCKAGMPPMAVQLWGMPPVSALWLRSRVCRCGRLASWGGSEPVSPQPDSALQMGGAERAPCSEASPRTGGQAGLSQSDAPWCRVDTHSCSAQPDLTGPAPGPGVAALMPGADAASCCSKHTQHKRVHCMSSPLTAQQPGRRCCSPPRAKSNWVPRLCRRGVCLCSMPPQPLRGSGGCPAQPASCSMTWRHPTESQLRQGRQVRAALSVRLRGRAAAGRHRSHCCLQLAWRSAASGGCSGFASNVRMPCSAGRSLPRAPDAHLPPPAAAPRTSCRAPAAPQLCAVHSPPSAPKEPLARGQKRRIAAAAASQLVSPPDRCSEAVWRVGGPRSPEKARYPAAAAAPQHTPLRS